MLDSHLFVTHILKTLSYKSSPKVIVGCLTKRGMEVSTSENNNLANQTVFNTNERVLLPTRC